MEYDIVPAGRPGIDRSVLHKKRDRDMACTQPLNPCNQKFQPGNDPGQVPMEQESGSNNGDVLDREEAEECFREGTALFTAGRYPEAIRAFEKALEARPRDARFLTSLAAAVDRLGFFSHALSLAAQAAAVAPLSPDAWFFTGLALYRRGDYTGAEDALSQAIALIPDHTEAWFFLGNCHYLSGEVEKSLDCFDRVLAISGRYPKALYNKGVSLADLGRYEEAVEAYRACLDMSPGVAVVLTNLGVALANLGQSEEAIRSFDEALAIDDRDPLTWHNKGLALAKLGREAEAMDCFSHFRNLAGDRQQSNSRQPTFR
jgi:tetratricopeptide (TPR) repeat protein